jgi:hypothetical protein
MAEDKWCNGESVWCIFAGAWSPAVVDARDGPRTFVTVGGRALSGRWHWNGDLRRRDPAQKGKDKPKEVPGG